MTRSPKMACARLRVYLRRLLRRIQAIQLKVQLELLKEENQKRMRTKGRNGKPNKPWER